MYIIWHIYHLINGAVYLLYIFLIRISFHSDFGAWARSARSMHTIIIFRFMWCVSFAVCFYFSFVLVSQYCSFMYTALIYLRNHAVLVSFMFPIQYCRTTHIHTHIIIIILVYICIYGWQWIMQFSNFDNIECG